MGGIAFNPSALRKKSILRDTSGNIINWVDEANGGWIIRARQVVNQARYDEEVKKEEDKRKASKAVVEQVSATPEQLAMRSGQIPLTTKPDTKVEDLEKKVNDMGSKLDAILNALKK
jgi:hypothetical protein